MSSPLIAIDIGTVRIGMAIADPDTNIAMPLTTIHIRHSDDPYREIADIIAQHGSTRIVVGWPLELDGSEGAAIKRTKAFLQRLKAVAPNIKIARQDERLSSVAAENALQAMQTTGSQKKNKVDAIAASLILQMFLDKKCK
ncbi:MAG: Holliday junction resolvase RuvX [Bradymonadales bacterium]|mgnify:FL=1|nr:Holliday junction resolvase RuvX [Bradymonadales bacterium]